MKKDLFLHGGYDSCSCPMESALKEGLEGVTEVLTLDLPLHPKEALDCIRDICQR